MADRKQSTLILALVTIGVVALLKAIDGYLFVAGTRDTLLVTLGG